MAKIRDQLDTESPHYYFSNIVYDTEDLKHKTGIAYLPPIEPQQDDIFYSLKRQEQYRPDKVSQRFYGTPHLDWVILFFNDIKDPFKEFTTGKSIVVPSPDYILNEYLTQLTSLISE